MPQEGATYVLGVDLGRLIDFTVLVVIKRGERVLGRDGRWFTEKPRVVHFERFNRIDWNLQKERIKACSQKYKDAIISIDSTGVGDPVSEELRFSALAVEDYKYTRESKRKLIDKLSMFIEQKLITYPNIPELLDELESFSFEKTDAGSLKYMAPSNKHDDCVNALALAVWPLFDESSIATPEGVWLPQEVKFN